MQGKSHWPLQGKMFQEIIFGFQMGAHLSATQQIQARVMKCVIGKQNGPALGWGKQSIYCTFLHTAICEMLQQT